MDLERRIKEVIAEKLGKSPDEIKDDATFIEDLGADSLDLVDMIMKLEEEFGVSIPDEELEKIKTVKDAIEYVKAKTGK